MSDLDRKIANGLTKRLYIRRIQLFVFGILIAIFILNLLSPFSSYDVENTRPSLSSMIMDVDDQFKSATEKYIIFTSRLHGNEELFVVEKSTGNVSQVTQTSKSSNKIIRKKPNSKKSKDFFDETIYAFSPDGRYIIETKYDEAITGWTGYLIRHGFDEKSLANLRPRGTWTYNTLSVVSEQFYEDRLKLEFDRQNKIIPENKFLQEKSSLIASYIEKLSKINLPVYLAGMTPHVISGIARLDDLPGRLDDLIKRFQTPDKNPANRPAISFENEAFQKKVATYSLIFTVLSFFVAVLGLVYEIFRSKHVAQKKSRLIIVPSPDEIRHYSKHK